MLQHACGRRWHLDIDLVGFEFDQRLVLADRVAFVLEPAGDRRLGDGFAHRRHFDFNAHLGVSSAD